MTLVKEAPPTLCRECILFSALYLFDGVSDGLLPCLDGVAGPLESSASGEPEVSELESLEELESLLSSPSPPLSIARA